MKRNCYHIIKYPLKSQHDKVNAYCFSLKSHYVFFYFFKLFFNICNYFNILILILIFLKYIYIIFYVFSNKEQPLLYIHTVWATTLLAWRKLNSEYKTSMLFAHPCSEYLGRWSSTRTSGHLVVHKFNSWRIRQLMRKNFKELLTLLYMILY